MKFDAKFYGIVRKVKDNSVVPSDEWMVFLVKDAAFPATLRFYYEECERLGADQEQLDSVERAIERLKTWCSDNPGRIKIPDAKNEKLLS